MDREQIEQMEEEQLGLAAAEEDQRKNGAKRSRSATRLQPKKQRKAKTPTQVCTPLVLRRARIGARYCRNCCR